MSVMTLIEYVELLAVLLCFVCGCATTGSCCGWGENAKMTKMWLALRLRRQPEAQGDEEMQTKHKNGQGDANAKWQDPPGGVKPPLDTAETSDTDCPTTPPYPPQK
eukprot:GHVT01034141.1.p6 GENE.GHVT01034141.1~~GHVT01034141.1.p6  ORF type:complete len:106 (+),score=30.39 GHVT01034141.1:1067-1384(+)